MRHSNVTRPQQILCLQLPSCLTSYFINQPFLPHPSADLCTLGNISLSLTLTHSHSNTMRTRWKMTEVADTQTFMPNFGVYIVFQIDPVATLEHLNDEPTNERARQMETKKYLGFTAKVCLCDYFCVL